MFGMLRVFWTVSPRQTEVSFPSANMLARQLWDSCIRNGVSSKIFSSSVLLLHIMASEMDL